MTNPLENNVRVYKTDGDYMPVLVITDKGDVILKGDTIHDDDHEAMAEGTAKGLTLAGITSKVTTIWYDNYSPKYNELTEEHQAFLLAHGQDEFLNEVKQYGDLKTES